MNISIMPKSLLAHTPRDIHYYYFFYCTYLYFWYAERFCSRMCVGFCKVIFLHLLIWSILGLVLGSPPALGSLLEPRFQEEGIPYTFLKYLKSEIWITVVRLLHAWASRESSMLLSCLSRFLLKPRGWGVTVCFHSGVVREQSSAIIPESLWRHSLVENGQGHQSTTILIYHLHLYLKSILHKPGMFSQI